MNGIVFSRPEMLPWMWSLVPLAAILGFAIWLRSRQLGRLVGKSLQPRVIAGRSLALEITKAVLALLATASILFALARPCWGEHLVPAPSKGADVVLVLDASLSMLATDAPPNRLELARRDLHRLVDQLGPSRLGLVVFAGTGLRMVPLTTDRSAVATVLEAASPDAVPRPGTDIAAAIASAGQILANSRASHRAVVVVTDGGDHGRNAETSAEELARTGAQLWVVGVGGMDAVPIPLPEGGYKQDKEGRTVTVALERDRLQSIANAGKGSYIELSGTQWALAPVEAAIARAAGHDGPEGTRSEPVERFPWFAGLAMLLLVLEIVLPRGTRRIPT